MCVGIPGKIVAITDAENLIGTVDIAGVRREVQLVCLLDGIHDIHDCIGDWVLVHVGFAMSRIDEAEAAKTLQLLAELGQMQDEMLAMAEADDALERASHG